MGRALRLRAEGGGACDEGEDSGVVQNAQQAVQADRRTYASARATSNTVPLPASATAPGQRRSRGVASQGRDGGAAGLELRDPPGNSRLRWLARSLKPLW